MENDTGAILLERKIEKKSRRDKMKFWSLLKMSYVIAFEVDK